MATLVSTNRDVMLATSSGHPLERFRLESVDVLRGVVMILMALDHTREYLGVTSIDPTSLTQTTVALFFTRWILHFCAPVFFLLLGPAPIYRCEVNPNGNYRVSCLPGGMADLPGMDVVSLFGYPVQF